MSHIELSEIRDRVNALDIPFNRYGLDKYGISRRHLIPSYYSLGWLYRHYFRVATQGIENVPDEGGALLVGNHSGGIPLDASMVITSMLFEKKSPRFVHAMVEYFAQKLPFLSPMFSRIGQLTGLPEHAKRLLRDGRLVLAFPEGARGTGKLYKDRYKLVRFGTGFMRMALETGVPIIPFAFIGGEEAVPAIFRLTGIARLIGVPYVPVPPQLLPVPLPVSCQIYYGKPMKFEGDGSECDEVIAGYVEQVRNEIAALIEHGLAERPGAFVFSSFDTTDAS